MEQRYELILKKISECRKAGNMKQVRIWRDKLHAWQREYGACAPIK